MFVRISLDKTKSQYAAPFDRLRERLSYQWLSLSKPLLYCIRHPTHPTRAGLSADKSLQHSQTATLYHSSTAKLHHCITASHYRRIENNHDSNSSSLKT